MGDEAHPYTVYDYTPTRSRDGPEEFLRAFRGYLEADAYSGYDYFYEEPARGIAEVACWAHAPRKHYEAQSSDLVRSTVMLAYIRLLYDVGWDDGPLRKRRPRCLLGLEMWHRRWTPRTWRQYHEEGESESELRVLRRSTYTGPPLGLRRWSRSEHRFPPVSRFG